jgi:cardiolipin synthase
MDWRNASKEDITIAKWFLPEPSIIGNTGVQIVSSGPDSRHEQIKQGYIKMINLAEKSVYIQTPYFIPDESIMEALRIAIASGVEVNLMIPNKPDHPFVYWATYSYAGELMRAGGRVFTYEQGFLHAKTIVVDEKIASVGTANFDVRSFKLNFEVNAFIYSKQIAKELTQDFKNDTLLSYELTKDAYYDRPTFIKFKESIARLLSPILNKRP